MYETKKFGTKPKSRCCSCASICRCASSTLVGVTSTAGELRARVIRIGGRFETSPAARIPDRVWSANPGADTARRNGPDGMFENENWPSAREGTSTAGEKPPSCDRVTVAPEMAAPVSSTMVPLTIPAGCWASGVDVCGKAGAA